MSDGPGRDADPEQQGDVDPEGQGDDGEPRDGDGTGGLESGGDEEIVELPIDGTLDLHHFHPRDVKRLVADYLDECRRRGILQVRIVHGKGTGALRRTVHSVLDSHPGVVTYRAGGTGGGGWGATIVVLRA